MVVCNGLTRRERLGYGRTGDPDGEAREPDRGGVAREFIYKRQHVLNGDWGAVQPGAEQQKRTWTATRAATKRGGIWADLAATDQTKARYAFAYDDLRRLHRTGLIAGVYRAAE